MIGAKSKARKRKPNSTASLTETISIVEDAKQAAWLRSQAKEALLLGRNDEAARLFGESAKILVEHDADIRLPVDVFPYAEHVHDAARAIQRMCHRRYRREESAQTLFAKLFRGHLARKQQRLRVNRRRACVICIQRGWWHYLTHKLNAATKIQSLYRMVFSKVRVEEYKLQLKSATSIQCFFRKKIARRVFLFMLLKWRSTALIQSNWRGYATRLIRFRAIWELHLFYCRMANIINKRFRGIFN